MSRIVLAAAIVLMASGCSRFGSSMKGTNRSSIPISASFNGPVKSVRMEEADATASGHGPKRVTGEWQYDERKHLLSASTTRRDGRRVTTSYSYDDEGRDTKEVQKIVMSNLYSSVTTTTYKYAGSSDKPTQRMVDDSVDFKGPDGKAIESTDHVVSDYIYDKAGMLIRVTGFLAGKTGDHQSRQGAGVSFNHDSDGRVVEETMTGKDVTTRKKYVYDNQGRKTIVQTSITTGKYTSEQVTNYEYDTQGNLNYERDRSDNSDDKTRYSNYQFDAHGNWIQRTVEEDRNPGGYENYKHLPATHWKFTEYRTIEYFKSAKP